MLVNELFEFRHFLTQSFSSIVDARPDEWKRSLTNYILPSPRQQHCLTFANNNILLFGG
jgi:hypothetical protein